MKFSYNAVWDLTVSLLRAHFAFAGAIAGVFIFLPTVLLGHLPDSPRLAALFRLLLSPELAVLRIRLVGSAVSTVLAIVLVLATASIYSALSSTETTASLFE